MSRITIYLDDDTAAPVDKAVKSAGTSKSKWIAEAVRRRACREWPARVAALAGAWKQFPSAEELRKGQPPDSRRGKL